MARPARFSPQKKQQIVLAVVRGEVSVAEAARGPTGQEAQLERELEQVTSALGEAHVELRLLKRGGADFASRSWR